MSAVPLLFSERMQQAILSGHKCCTTRRTKKAEPGDWFEIGGETFRILDIRPAPLYSVRDTLFRLEGCTSPDDFECLWRSLHGGAFSPLLVCWVHFFVRFPIPYEILEADREAAALAAEDQEVDA